MTKVALVDDHQLFRKSLSLLLESFEGVTVVYETDNGLLFLKYLEECKIDVLFLDLEMPLMHGFNVCKQAKLIDPSLKVIILSQLNSKEAVHQVMEIGANGYFTKNSSPEMLENAIQNVMDRDYYFDMALSSVISEAMLWKNRQPMFSETQSAYLTPKEIEIIKLATQEKCSKEIADVLNISPRTVEKHRNHIMEKTKSKNFIGVILFALKNQIIELEKI
jgi:DNA-binding NarL/FixJ family response regulator